MKDPIQEQEGRRRWTKQDPVEERRDSRESRLRKAGKHLLASFL